MWTEDEARKKECRVGGTIDQLGRRVFPHCIASGCMHWTPTAFAQPPFISPISGKVIAQGTPAKGKCGLMGHLVR